VTADVVGITISKIMSTHVTIAGSANQGQVLIMNENRVAFGCALCSTSYQRHEDTALVFVTHIGNILKQIMKRTLGL
jgi:hypothetical protein